MYSLLAWHKNFGRAMLTGKPTLHGSKVGGWLSLAVLDYIDSTPAEHGNGQTGRASDGFLAGGNDTIQTPVVKSNLLAGNTADAVGDDQGFWRHALDQVGQGFELKQDASGSVDVSCGDELVLLLLERLLDLVELRSTAHGPSDGGDLGAVGGEAIRECITKVAAAQNENVLAWFHQVDGNNVPTQSAGTVDDEGLRSWVGGLE